MTRRDPVSRRTILRGAVGASIVPFLPSAQLLGVLSEADELRFGLVTYLWGRDLRLLPLLDVCKRAGIGGVELRTTHAHGVEPSLSAAERAEARMRIEDSGVVLVGLGSNERFDSPDPSKVRSAIEATKRFLQLSADLGGGGVKVKPDRFHEGIDREKTINQIAASLREVGTTASDLDQEVRLEVHGGCAEPRVIRAIMDETGMDSVRVCWNCNAQDLRAPGLDANFDMLRPFFGDTLHVRELDSKDYPLSHLVARLIETDWFGWVLLEAHSEPGPVDRRAEDLRTQRGYFDAMVMDAKRTASTDLLVMRTKRTDQGIEIFAGDELFAATQRTERGPVLFPLNAPGGHQVVRGFPLEKRAGESTDHPHHRSCWLAHGDVNGHDFWHDPNAHVSLTSEEVVLTECEQAAVRWKADWRVGDEVILKETRTMTFSGTEDSRRIEFDIELVPNGEETVVFGDTKEGTFALRLAPSLKVDGGAAARGRIENRQGLADKNAWGKQSEWVLAEGPLEGRLVRVKISDDSSNPRFPTWWHARTYGLIAANPFGRRAFEGANAAGGAIQVTRADPLRLRYVIEITSF